MEISSNDFTQKLLPGWLFVTITSGIILSFRFDYPGFFMLEIIFYLASLISILLIFTIFIIKPISKPLHEKIVGIISRIYEQ